MKNVLFLSYMIFLFSAFCILESNNSVKFRIFRKNEVEKSFLTSFSIINKHYF